MFQKDLVIQPYNEKSIYFAIAGSQSLEEAEIRGPSGRDGIRILVCSKHPAQTLAKTAVV